MHPLNHSRLHRDLRLRGTTNGCLVDVDLPAPVEGPSFLSVSSASVSYVHINVTMASFVDNDDDDRDLAGELQSGDSARVQLTSFFDSFAFRLTRWELRK